MFLAIPGAGFLVYGIYQQMPSGTSSSEDGKLALKKREKHEDQRCSHLNTYISILERRLDKIERDYKEEITYVKEKNKDQAKRILELEKARKWRFWPWF